jgi:2-keto-4-pentenoate hydratase
MKNNNSLLAAKILFNHRLKKIGLEDLPKNLKPKTIEESYDIQNELKLLYLSLKDNFIIGKKIGCTNKLAQEQLNIFEPFYGNLFSKFSDENNCQLKSTKFFRPFVEPEISFRIREDININKAPFLFDDAMILFDFMFPSVELVDFRFGENIMNVGIKNLIASNGASEFYIKSKNKYKLDEINLENQIIRIYVNNKLADEGNTNLVLGNPINSAIWLINKLAFLGEPMLSGQFITTGTCSKAIKLKKNNIVKADFGKMGVIEFNYI